MAKNGIWDKIKQNQEKYEQILWGCNYPSRYLLGLGYKYEIGGLILTMQKTWHYSQHSWYLVGYINTTTP